MTVIITIIAVFQWFSEQPSDSLVQIFRNAENLFFYSRVKYLVYKPFRRLLYRRIMPGAQRLSEKCFEANCEDNLYAEGNVTRLLGFIIPLFCHFTK